MVKCSKCNKKAEYFLPDVWNRPKEVLCEGHAMNMLKSGTTNFLPRLKTK